MKALSTLLVLASVSLAGDPYVVLDGASNGEAAAMLAAHRKARVIKFDPKEPRAVLPALQRIRPRWVAVFLDPGALDFNFVRAFLQLSTEIDEDPFVDFSYGYFTGATAEETIQLVRRTMEAKPHGDEGFILGKMSGSAKQSTRFDRPYPLRKRFVKSYYEIIAGDDEGHDRAATKRALRTLTACRAVMFIGHGWPKEVVHCADFADIAGLRLENAVVFNVACYTGVTRHYFEPDWRAGVVKRKTIDTKESFCLGVLRSGAVGYTAYMCPRPAGPELDTDLSMLVEDGLALGDARRRDYDKTVLGFLGYGEKRLDLKPVRAGAKVVRASDPVREMMLEGATGGVVFGDPAFVPFPKPGRTHPAGVRYRYDEGSVLVTAECPRSALFVQCADPTAKFGKTMAMKVYARVPLRGKHVAGVEVVSLKVGGQAQRTRLIWAVEEDRGERFCQLKVMFPRGAGGDLAARVKIATTGDAARAATFGGEVVKVKEVSKDPTSAELKPFMLEAAKARNVSREALQAALDANAAIFRGDLTKNDALKKFGSEGFRAVCALLDVGHHHFRTGELLALTHGEGDEKLLLEMAGRELPNCASWTVLGALGYFDTPQVRGYLMVRLLAETDAGEFMATARGLARLKEQKAVAPIARELTRFQDHWRGVEAYLVMSLGRIGGADAVQALERYALDERAKQVARAIAELDRLDPAAANRVRNKRTK